MKAIDILLSTISHGAPVRGKNRELFQKPVLTRCCGLASTSYETAPHHVKTLVRETGSLIEKLIPNLYSFAGPESLYETTIGTTVANSLVEIDENNCLNFNA